MLRKRYYKTEAQATEVLKAILESCNVFLSLQYCEKKKMYFIEY